MDEAHPDLRSGDDVDRYVADLRQRWLGRSWEAIERAT